MKTTLFNTVSAIALTGLAFTLTPATLSAHEHSKGGNSLGHGDRHNSGHGHGSRTCSRLPHGCRPTSYRGERCWFGGGHYYRCNTVGTYEIIDQPEVEYTETVVEQPVVTRRVVETEVEEPAYEEESEEVVSYLPESCETVYVGGERCFYSNGCYYRHCGHGYKKFHCKGDRGHGRTCKNDRGHNPSHGTKCSTGRHNNGKGAQSYHTKGSRNARSASHSSGHGKGHK